MAASPTSEDKKPTLGEVIESIGIGPAQFRAGLLGGGVWLADGAELLLIGSVADTLAREWHLSSFTKGFVVTIVYTGLMFGNITSGPAGARFGRREVVVLSFFGIFVFSIFSSTSQSITVLMIWRFIVGWSIGFGQPAWLAISAEITPAKYRIITGGLTQTLFALGELYSASLLMLDDPSLQKLDWRRVIALGAIPSAILFIFSALFLHQSPTFLQMKGRHADAVQVLESMRHDNSAPDISVDFRLQPQNAPQLGFIETFYRQSKVIMSNKLLVPTLVTMFTCFELNLAYYGCIYAFPQVLSDLVAEGAAKQLLIGALWELPGVCLGVVLGMTYLRKTGLKIYLTTLACVMLLFIIGGNNHHRHWVFDVCLYAGYYGVKMAPNLGFVLIYQVANEIYPTEARTTGCGVCLAAGRMAALLGPLVYEGSVELTGTWLSFFLLMAAGAVMNLYLCDLIPETAHLVLDDHDPKMYGDKAND